MSKVSERIKVLGAKLDVEIEKYRKTQRQAEASAKKCENKSTELFLLMAMVMNGNRVPTEEEIGSKQTEMDKMAEDVAALHREMITIRSRMFRFANSIAALREINC